MIRAATISPCGKYRVDLTRTWDDRPVLVVCLFNPSNADHQIDDPTVTLLCHIASFNGFGGIKVVNGIPLRSSTPKPALQMLEWHKTSEWYDRDRLQQNLAHIQTLVATAGAVLLAWGALAGQTEAAANWFEFVREEIENELPEGTPVYCLGKTKGGYPKHPMARGKHKVPKDAPLILWSST